MANFKDKFSGKEYRKEKFTSLSASIAANPVLDGRRHEFYTGSDSLKILPYRIKRGDQAKFFPGLASGSSHAGIETGSIIRDTVRQIVYVPIKKKNYQNNLIGVGSHISSAFASSAYLEISAAFAEKFDGVDGETIFTFNVEELYNSPSASRSAFNIDTASNDFKIQSEGTPGTNFVTQSFSTIDSGSSPNSSTFDLSFDTAFATHWEYYTGVTYGNKNLQANGWYPTASIIYPGPQVAGGDTDNPPSASLLTNEPFLTLTSGSCVGIGQAINANHENGKDGFFHRYVSRFIIKGDADSGSLYQQQQGQVEIISLPSSSLDNLASGSFRFDRADRNGAKTSTDFRTLYFYSGSGVGSKGAGGDSAAQLVADNHGLFVTCSDQLGSPVFADANLKINPEPGFYSSNTTVTILVTTSSEGTFGGPLYAQSPQPLVVG